MKFTCLATGSKGNCYLLESNGRILVLDAGIPYNDIIRGTGYAPRKIDGVVVTHDHKDHSYSASELKNKGFKVWQPYLEDNKLRSKVFGVESTPIEAPANDWVDWWAVYSFGLEHDGVPCVGYLIKNDHGTILYATDFEFIKYDFSRVGITDMIIEVNYTDDMLDLDEYKYNHVLRGHAELNTTKAFIEKHNDSLKNVILVHASAGLDTERVEKEIEEMTLARVITATKGMEIIL